MDRVAAYAALAAVLEEYRARSFDELAVLIGSPPGVSAAQAGTESIDVEVRITWEDRRKQAIRIEATANGPSCWRLERLEESVVVTNR